MPDDWEVTRRSCLEMADRGGWEYMLWTEGRSREFIERVFPWFLATYDGWVSLILFFFFGRGGLEMWTRRLLGVLVSARDSDLCSGFWAVLRILVSAQGSGMCIGFWFLLRLLGCSQDSGLCSVRILASAQDSGLQKYICRARFFGFEKWFIMLMGRIGTNILYRGQML